MNLVSSIHELAGVCHDLNHIVAIAFMFFAACILVDVTRNIQRIVNLLREILNRKG